MTNDEKWRELRTWIIKMRADDWNGIQAASENGEKNIFLSLQGRRLAYSLVLGKMDELLKDEGDESE